VLRKAHIPFVCDQLISVSHSGVNNKPLPTSFENRNGAMDRDLVGLVEGPKYGTQALHMFDPNLTDINYLALKTPMSVLV